MKDLKSEVKSIDEFAELIKALDEKQKEAIKNIIIGMKLARES